ncbi:MAG: IS5 family transposase [Anaerolineae bacterium]|nr:IS5 family transposase [Anaerolineae bacterium]
MEKRGSLTVWVSEEAIKAWTDPEQSGAQGRPVTYSDMAIECMAMLQAVYRLPLRGTRGLVQSIFELMQITLSVPHYSTLSRRKRKLDVKLPKRKPSDGVHVVIDSTGVKVFGEGEWKVRQHGYTKRRTWKKMHIAVDEATGEILAVGVTDNSITDGTMLPPLLDDIEEPITRVSGDKAYDKRKCYEAIRKRKAKASIPPQKGARIWQHGNTKGERHNRDENIRAIRKKGRAAWKRESGYHRRSIAETSMSRYKRILGPTISARTFEGQSTEIKIRCKILNTMTQMGRPDSVLMG